MGFEIDRFIGEVNDGLLCCICRDVLEDPVQSPCEHAFCSSCIHGWLVHENCCPEDRQPLYTAQLRPLFRYMRNDLDKLRVRCRHFDGGCQHVSDLEHVSRHEDHCGFEVIECPSVGCSERAKRQHIERHLESCDFRTRDCPRGCGLQILNHEDSEHSCMAELRTAIEILRAEMICKVDDQRQEMDLRLDAQRRHMVQRDGLLRGQIDELKSQMCRQTQDIKLLLETERQRRLELERMDLEKRELLDLLRGVHKDQVDGATGNCGTKKHVCRSCQKTEKVTLL